MPNVSTKNIKKHILSDALTRSLIFGTIGPSHMSMDFGFFEALDVFSSYSTKTSAWSLKFL